MKAEEARKDRARTRVAYRSVARTADGETVLEDLRAEFGRFRPEDDQGVAIGKRMVIDYIDDMIGED